MNEVEEFVGPPRMEIRESNPFEIFSSYMAQVTSLCETMPTTYEEGFVHQVSIDTMMKEYNSIMKNGVWEVVLRLEGNSVVTSKWLYKIKHDADGSIKNYKARFVARGFSQIEGFYYDKNFASIAIFSSIRAYISIMEEMG